jgi:4-hydroxy-tetrahydrodipicolinate synthase
MNYSELSKKIHGPVYSILTPFKEGDAIDWFALENYLTRAYNEGARNFFLMGYNSRFSQLSWEEIKVLSQFVVQKVKSLDPNNICIVADPLHCSTKVTIDFCQHAESIGADVISLIVREKFYSNDQMISHFRMVSEESAIPILVHEMPFLNGYGGPVVNYDLDLLDQLADMEHVVAIKEDAKDDEYSAQVINKIKDRVAIVISGGGKRQWLRFADIGCQSWLNGVGVFRPYLAANFYRAYQNGDMDYCNNLIEDIEVPFFENGVKKFGWHLTIKAAMQHQGWFHRRDRMPLKELSDTDYRAVASMMDTLPLNKYKNF